MPQQTKNWIDDFMVYTDGRGSPKLWRKWAAIFTIAAVIERKVWITTAKGKLYPNMYAVCVGGAGEGKSLATGTVRDFLENMKEKGKLHLAPSSVTKASLIDSLATAERKIVNFKNNPSMLSYNALAIVPNELGVFLPSYDTEFMNALTDLWDCKNYSETRRTNKLSIDIPNVQLNMFSATTPSYLNSFLPEGAWEQGFMSRVILLYSSGTEYTDLFAIFENDDTLMKDMMASLDEIGQHVGELHFHQDVKDAINAWARGGCEPVPTHPKLTHYNARRPAHLLKLCMVSAMASGERQLIRLEHFVEALDWLVEAETFMPDIFKAMKTGGDGRVIEECYHFIYETYIRENKKPVLEHRIVHFLQERTPAHNVSKIIEVMERAGLMAKGFAVGGDTGHAYTPKMKRAA